MRNGIFVTGGSGFVGRRLLAALLARDSIDAAPGRPLDSAGGTLDSAQRPTLFALDRSGMLSREPEHHGLTVVRGDLLEPTTYRDALRSCRVVLHLAAATGRAPADEHSRVNARGTEVLLDECRRTGVERLVFVSSIATTFPETAAYHYAQSKRRAEETVRRSGIAFVILRPTIILGPGAPLLKSLEKLALLPILPIPGSGRARVQPVHVDDVVASIVAAAEQDRMANDTFEVGGPETLTIEDLLRRIRRARLGTDGPVAHIPYVFVHTPLRALEAAGLGHLLPLTAGQLSSFRFDGVAAIGASSDGTPRIGLERMIAPGDEPSPDVQLLHAECRVFTRHLLGYEPDDYVRARYAAAHRELRTIQAADAFDETLIAFARIGPLCARLADSYAGVMARDATIRKKLVLLLAILETRPPFHQAIDAPVGTGPQLWLSLLARTAGAAIAFAAGALVFVPTRIVVALTGKTSA